MGRLGVALSVLAQEIYIKQRCNPASSRFNACSYQTSFAAPYEAEESELELPLYYMKSVRLLRWGSSILSPHTRPRCSLTQCQHQLRYPLYSRQTRLQSISSAAQQQHASEDDHEPDFTLFPSPPPEHAKASARLNALHARLALSPRLPVETLARCLIHSSADPNPHFNNASLSVLGHDILGYYTAEAILCRYPRLPTEVVFSAIRAFCGPKTLATIAREWGTEVAAAPGGEVDPGLLQFSRREAGNAPVDNTGIQLKELEGKRKGESIAKANAEQKGWRRGVSSKTIHGDYSGNEPTPSETGTSSLMSIDHKSSDPPLLDNVAKSTTLEDASTSFVQALFGALYLHTGLPLTKAFYTSHILSRHLDYSALFSFRQPTRDLARLCARENFLPPVARVIAETGRQSRHPVFVVGVFSGREKLGEGSGGSLDEARIRAAVSALKGWYLYSPLDVKVPSQAKRGEEFLPVMIDGGEVIV